MGANFTPDMQGYTSMKPFKFWCQKVLPTIYDDSLSYYEVLCKLVKYLNTVIENMEKVEANVDALLNAFNLLQGWVNDYFDNLDVQDEIDNKLDRMVEDGTFDRYIEPIIQSYEGDLQALLNQYGDDARELYDGYADDARELYDDYANDARAFVLESEAWAKGTKDGVPVPNDAPQYHDNSKYWAEQAQQAAQDAGTALQDAESAVADAEDAKQAAEDAQEAAEQAAQSVDLKGNIYVVHVSNCTVYDIDSSNTSFVCSDSPAFDLYNLVAQYHAPVFALPHDVNAGYTFTLAGNRYMSGRYIPQWHVLDAVGNPVTAGSTVSFDIYLIPQDKCTESNGSNYVPQ